MTDAPVFRDATKKLPDLLRRVREAKEGSTEIDLAVTRICDVRVNTYSESVDAVLSLIADRLPGWEWRTNSRIDETFDGYVWRLDGDPAEVEEYRQDAPTPALALLAAALEAISAKEGK